jgi:hypothetical protein
MSIPVRPRRDAAFKLGFGLSFASGMEFLALSGVNDLTAYHDPSVATHDIVA